MSVVFSSARPRSKGEVTQQSIQKMLDENHHLIQCIMDYQSRGKTAECTQYQQILHRNLVYLATIADSNQNMQTLLPAPPTSSLSVGPGGMGQSGGHGPSNLNDTMAQAAPPTSMMQSHMTNVPMMHQQSAPPHYSSAQTGGQPYQGQQVMGVMGQLTQGNSVMSQRSMGSYRSSQQGSVQQYVGQEEFYGDQFGHSQSSSEPANQQFYPDGHGEYAYQQSTYGEQAYDRSFEEPSQHFFEGGNRNSQYSQQQSHFQQSSGQQQQQPAYGQQPYPSQQGYAGQQHSYGPGQTGSSQYPQYQQGQSQQYGTYRSAQGAPGAPTQRPYAYEQGQYGNYQQ
ncbi:calcium-responsive transactivator isoform X2 [Cynoglossus semilaevis]|uniref:calcium-responsive transactivator isoform X2 n=1 Tax=Cynoglossus semilaevis TaxID=244447 RepID=UPI0004963F44|nr:calcium-responsive transactivator isoform X2 [Cynoglossus semilaevis]